MEYTTIEKINQYEGTTINPMKMPDNFYELYSVPSFESGHPEIIKGSDIGSSKITVAPNDILICKINPRINRIWVVGDESDYEKIASSEWIVVRTKDFNPEFLKWYFSSRRFINLMTSEITGIGGSLTRAQPKRVKQYPVPVVPIEQQNHIVSMLNKLKAITDNKKKEIDDLNMLIKSRFVEMFGDPIVNDKNWITSKLIKVTTKIGSGATPKGGRDSYQSEGISLIRSMNVHDGYFEYKDLAHINDDQAESLNNVIVEKDDVFINITGASVARSCVVPNEILPARVNQHVSIIRCKKDLLNPIFANYMFLNSSFKKTLLSIGESGGATRQAITKQQLENLIVITPPISLQNQFSDFVHQVDKSKLAIQKSLDETQLLFDSLMQKYFG